MINHTLSLVLLKEGEHQVSGISGKGLSRTRSNNSRSRVGSVSPIMNGHTKIVNGGGYSLPADISKELEKRNIGQRYGGKSVNIYKD